MEHRWNERTLPVVSPKHNRKMAGWIRDILAGEFSFLRQLDQNDRSQLIAFARKHGIGPALYLALKEPLREICRDDLIELKRIYREDAQNNILLFHELGKVLKALGDAGIPVIVLKGACLAEAVYGNIALRSMIDADLLVKKCDLNKAAEVLKQCGYSANYDFQVDKEIALQLQHLPTLKAAKKPLIEIHWTIFDYTYFKARDEDEAEVGKI